MLKEQKTEKLIAQLFDNLTDSVVWFAPVFENNESSRIVDFEVQYCNHAAAKILNAPRPEITGTFLRTTTLMDELSIELIFQQCTDVWQSGRPVEFTYYNAGFDRYFNVQRSKVEGGILSVTRDRTSEVILELERKEQDEMYRQILNTAADGIMLLKAVRNEANEITDFRLAHCNKKGIETGQLPANAVGRTILELLPHLRHSEQFEIHRKVVQTGEPVRFETAFRDLQGRAYGWFIVSLTKMGDGVISNFVDVTEKKNREEQIESQKNLLQKILDASLDAVYTCEAVRNAKGEIVDLRFVQINNRFRQFLPDPGLNVIGTGLLELFPATGPAGLLRRLSGVIESGEPARFELNYRNDRSNGWYEVSAVKLERESVVVSFIETTEHKNAMHELHQQKTLLDNILQHSANGISVTRVLRNDRGEVVDGRTILANEAAVKFTGIPRELYLGKTATELDPNIIHSEYYRLCLQTLQNGEPRFTQYFLELTERWLEISISKLDDEHIITIFTDITPTKQTQLRLEQSLTELKRANESLEEFTRAASHDLKEPIRKVQFFSERLKQKLENRLSTEESQMVERMENAAGRMKVLVDDLLEYSQVSQEAILFEEISLDKKLRLVLSDLELVINEKNAVIEADDLPVVKGHRRQLQQLFYNLLSNALKYSRPGVAPVVRIRASRVIGAASGFAILQDEQAKTFHLIEVEDNGIGFDQQYADKIFNVFTRLHGNAEYSGTGVGLAIVQKVVKNHHGYVSAHSEVGKGSTFRVLLPRLKAAVAECFLAISWQYAVVSW